MMFVKKKLIQKKICDERAYKKAELQLYVEKKFVKADLNNVSTQFYPTALCKLGPQNKIAKKQKMNDF